MAVLQCTLGATLVGMLGTNPHHTISYQQDFFHQIVFGTCHIFVGASAALLDL